MTNALLCSYPIFTIFHDMNFSDQQFCSSSPLQQRESRIQIALGAQWRYYAVRDGGTLTRMDCHGILKRHTISGSCSPSLIIQDLKTYILSLKMIASGDGSDITIGWVNPGACVDGCLASYSASVYPNENLDESVPKDADQSSSTLVNAEVDGNGIMLIEFDRDLNTGVGGDHIIDVDAETTVIWAYNPSPGAMLNDAGTSFEKHFPQTRGSSVITFSDDSPTCVFQGVSPTNGESFTNEAGTFHAAWAVIDDSITFELTVEDPDRWVAIGFSESASMINSDIVLGYVTEGLDVVVGDRWASARSTPGLDVDRGGTDDLVKVSGSRNDTHAR